MRFPPEHPLICKIRMIQVNDRAVALRCKISSVSVITAPIFPRLRVVFAVPGAARQVLIAPPALIPTEMIRSISPGSSPRLLFRKRMPAFRSTRDAGDFPQRIPSAFSELLPRSHRIHRQIRLSEILLLHFCHPQFQMALPRDIRPVHFQK